MRLGGNPDSKTAPDPTSTDCPRFSICIPNFNNGAFIGRAIESALAQTYPGCEIVVADNKSTDDSVEVVMRYASDGVRLVRNTKNLGLAPNFDRVVEASRGRHVLLLSADDLMYPTALEEYARVLDDLGDRSDAAVLVSAYDVIDEHDTLTALTYRKGRDLSYRTVGPAEAADVPWGGKPVEHTGHEILTRALRSGLAPAPFLATCYPRRLYDQVHGYRNGFRAWPDTHFALKLLSVNPVFVYIPMRLFAYRIHTNNQFRSFDRASLLYYQIDSYLHVTEFPDDVLDAVGVARGELASTYVRRAILGRAQRAIANGSPRLALRYLLFGLATQPQLCGRRRRTYGLFALAMAGRIGAAIAAKLPDEEWPPDGPDPAGG